MQFLLVVYKISHLNIHPTATGEHEAQIHMQRGADWWSGIFKLKGLLFNLQQAKTFNPKTSNAIFSYVSEGL